MGISYLPPYHLSKLMTNINLEAVSQSDCQRESQKDQTSLLTIFLEAETPLSSYQQWSKVKGKNVVCCKFPVYRNFTTKGCKIITCSELHFFKGAVMELRRGGEGLVGSGEVADYQYCLRH